jgi:hypothetical protein
LGSHLVTPQRVYLHHGIYVGARKVVRCSGRVHSLRRGAVEEIPFAHFARGLRVWVRSDAPSLKRRHSSSLLPAPPCGKLFAAGPNRRALFLFPEVSCAPVNGAMSCLSPGGRRLADDAPERTREMRLIAHAAAQGDLT